MQSTARGEVTLPTSFLLPPFTEVAVQWNQKKLFFNLINFTIQLKIIELGGQRLVQKSDVIALFAIWLCCYT